MVNYNSIFYIVLWGIVQLQVYDQLYSAVHPMKYLESDVMWYIKGNSLKTKLLLL